VDDADGQISSRFEQAPSGYAPSTSSFQPLFARSSSGETKTRRAIRKVIVEPLSTCLEADARNSWPVGGQMRAPPCSFSTIAAAEPRRSGSAAGSRRLCAIGPAATVNRSVAQRASDNRLTLEAGQWRRS
jgi:hypothetical protein